MADDINQILGLAESENPTQKVTESTPNENCSEEAQTQKQANTQNVSTTSSDKSSNGAENTLNTIAYLVLICGILCGILLLFTICFIDNPNPYSDEKKIFNPEGFGTTVGVFFTSLATWALFRVIVNISKSLKDIKKKL